MATVINNTYNFYCLDISITSIINISWIYLLIKQTILTKEP